jgi:hypothetical protein
MTVADLIREGYGNEEDFNCAEKIFHGAYGKRKRGSRRARPCGFPHPLRARARVIKNIIT